MDGTERTIGRVVGLVISLQNTAVCVLDRDGQLVWHRTVNNEPGPAWGVSLARRLGTGRPCVAVARKLAVIMHRMWDSGGKFETGVEGSALAGAQHRLQLLTIATWTTGSTGPTRTL